MSKSFNELEDEIEYRPISGFAIAAFVLSLISAIALANVLMIFVPILAILLCGAALFSIRNSQKVIGGNLAWAGIGVGCFVISLSLSQFYWLESSRWTTARRHADTWLKLIQEGEQEQAHQLTLAVNERQTPDQDLSVYYAPENSFPRRGTGGARQPQTEYQPYWDSWYPQKLILQDGTKGRFEFVGQGAPVENRKNRDYYLLKYRYYPADPELKSVTAGINNAIVPCPIEFEIKMERAELGKPLGVQWQVFSTAIDGAVQRHAGVTIDEG